MNKKYIIAATIFIVLTLAVLTFILITSREEEVVIRLDREEYSRGEKARVSVRNWFWNSEICFSSCYPYFLQRENGSWREYGYEDCNFEDKIVKCVKPFQKKIFQTTIPCTSDGTYRISVPICKDCNLGTVFNEETRFYSDKFKIK